MQVDPIGAYGVPVSNHMHTFSNMQPGSTMKPSILRGTFPGSNCISPNLTGKNPNGWGAMPDKALYWMPALKSTNLPAPGWVNPEDVLVYYRNAGVDPDDIVPFDQDYSFRAGDPNATDEQESVTMEWSCVANRDDDDADDNEVNFGPVIPPNCPMYFDEAQQRPYQLRLVVYFPNCVHFPSATRPNGQWVPTKWKYATFEQGEPGEPYNWACVDEPGLDYDAIPQVQIGFRWPLGLARGVVPDTSLPSQWDLSSLRVASDATGQPGGITGHADFMSGWSTAQLSKLVKTCFWGEERPVEAGYGPQNCGAINDTLGPFYGEN